MYYRLRFSFLRSGTKARNFKKEIKTNFVHHRNMKKETDSKNNTSTYVAFAVTHANELNLLIESFGFENNKKQK